MFAVLESLCCGEGSTVDGSIIFSLIFLDKFHTSIFFIIHLAQQIFFLSFSFFIVAQNSTVPFRTVVARETGEGRPFKEEIGC